MIILFSREYTLYCYTQSYSRHRFAVMSVVSSVVFEQNPPANLRKSNFFSFVCRLLDSNNQVLRILSAVCIDFIDNQQVPFLREIIVEPFGIARASQMLTYDRKLQYILLLEFLIVSNF